MIVNRRKFMIGLAGLAAFSVVAKAQKPEESIMWQGDLLDKLAPRRLKPGMTPKEEDAVRDRVALAFQQIYTGLGVEVVFYTWGKDPRALKIMDARMDKNVAHSYISQFNENSKWMQALRDVKFVRVIVQNVSRQGLKDTNLKDYLIPNERPFRGEYTVTDKGLVASRPPIQKK